MPDALSLVLFIIAVIVVCFVVHIMCQNHKLNKEKVVSADRISRMFDHLVVRCAREAKEAEDWMQQYRQNSMAWGAFCAFRKIYEGSRDPSLSEIIGLDLDLVEDAILKMEDKLKEIAIQSPPLDGDEE